MGRGARDRRKLRKAVEAILQTYGYSTSPPNVQGERHQTIWDFILKYLAPAIGLVAFGYKVAESSILLASASYLLALLVVLRGFKEWCTTRPKTITLRSASITVLLVFGWLDYHWIRDTTTPTFLYLVPSHELIDCQRRAFFVNHSGPKPLQNVKIVIKDNKSGNVQESNDFGSGIEPGPQNPDAPRYIWVIPSHPWDEDYTITVTATGLHSIQETILRSANKSVQFAVRIAFDPTKKPLATCRDASLSQAYSLARDSQESCNRLMGVDPALLNQLKPEFNGFQQPNGNYTVVRLRKLPSPPELDSQSEDRHLTEYEQSIMRSKLSKYAGAKIELLYAGGPKTLAYAKIFRDFFRSIQWQVDGPRLVPPGNEGMVDIQVSVSKHYWNTPYPRGADLLSSLEGLKHTRRYVYDEAIQPDLIVLWIGPQSPSNFTPDDCAPASLRPRLGEPHTCEFVRQAPGVCPFPPQ